MLEFNFCGTSFRFINIFHLFKIDNENIWNIVKEVKYNMSQEEGCDHGMYSDTLSLVKEVEKLLGIYSSEQIFKNTSNGNLTEISEMFLYLNLCIEKPWKSWIQFYTELFNNESPALIMLTLNRILKNSTISEDNDFKGVAKEVFKQLAIKYSFTYKEIQNVTQDVRSSNKKYINNIEGTYVFELFQLI